MKNKIYALLIAVLIASMLLTACAKPQPTQAPTQEATGNGGGVPVPAGDLYVASNVILDPALAVDEEDRVLAPYLYEGLVRAEGDEIIAVLATKWTVSVDELDYIFELRPGVTFHDGTPLNADAVIANFNRWFDPTDALRGTGTYDAWKIAFLGFKGETTAEGHPVSSFDGIEKVNDLTVLVHLNQPVDDLMFKLSDEAFAIVSPAALAADGFGTNTGKEGGTGAYMLSEWSDSGLTFAPNASYWDPAVVPTDNLFVAFND